MSKEYEDMVANLEVLLNGWDAEVIDDVLAVIRRKQIDVEILQERKNGLAKLFDSQMETLKSRGCPHAILEAFQSKYDEMLSKVLEIEISEGHIPFVPVIPRTYMGVYGLMSMVRNGEKVGYTFLDPNEITDNVETPKVPYFIYDVEDGKDILGESPKKAERLIKKQNRFCLTTDEGIAVCVHTGVLSKHSVYFIGSIYDTKEEYEACPSICLDSDGRPKLGWRNNVISLGNKLGFASCHSRG